MRAGEQGGSRIGKVRRGSGLASLARPKSRYFRGTSINQKNVGGFDVAVDDAFGMGRFQAVGDLNADVQEVGDRQWVFPRCDV